MTCSQCGAAIKRGDGRFCSHCGASLPDRPRITAEEWVTHIERFEQAERDEQHAFAQTLPAPAPQLFLMVVVPTIFLVFWLGLGSVVIGGFASAGGAIVLFPLAIVSIGAIGIIWAVVRALRNARAPIHRSLAVIVGDRTEISTTGAGDNRSTRTRYYATLHFKDGSRLELSTSGPIAGSITQSDIGLAVMRAGDLIDFHRYRI
jgi:hypothetical protein